MRSWTLLVALTLTSLGCAGSWGPTASCEQDEVCNPGAKVLDRAEELVSEHIGDEPDAVELIEAKWVHFPNAALGCERPDGVYASVESPGYLVLLHVRVDDSLHLVDLRLTEEYGLVCASEAVEATSTS